MIGDFQLDQGVLGIINTLGLILIFSLGWPPLTPLRQEQGAPPPCRQVGLEVQVPYSISLDTGKGHRAAPCSGSLFAPRWLGGAGVPCYCSPVGLCWHWWGRRVGLITARQLSSDDRTQQSGRGTSHYWWWGWKSRLSRRPCPTRMTLSSGEPGAW